MCNKQLVSAIHVYDSFVNFVNKYSIIKYQNKYNRISCSYR